jgi:hypothetical protein
MRTELEEDLACAGLRLANVSPWDERLRDMHAAARDRELAAEASASLQ